MKQIHAFCESHFFLFTNVNSRRRTTFTQLLKPLLIFLPMGLVFTSGVKSHKLLKSSSASLSSLSLTFFFYLYEFVRTECGNVCGSQDLQTHFSYMNLDYGHCVRVCAPPWHRTRVQASGQALRLVLGTAEYDERRRIV